MSTNSSFWRSCSAIVPGTMYSWIRGEKKDLVFTIMEKYLFRQKILIACGLNPEITRSLNSEAFKSESNGINLERLSRCTALPKSISEPVTNRRVESQTTRRTSDLLDAPICSHRKGQLVRHAHGDCATRTSIRHGNILGGVCARSRGHALWIM